MQKVKAGISFPDGLLLAFIILKLCKVIDWSWVWILSPLWIQCALSIVIELLKTRKRRKE